MKKQSNKNIKTNKKEHFLIDNSHKENKEEQLN